MGLLLHPGGATDCRDFRFAGNPARRPDAPTQRCHAEAGRMLLWHVFDPHDLRQADFAVREFQSL